MDRTIIHPLSSRTRSRPPRAFGLQYQMIAIRNARRNFATALACQRGKGEEKGTDGRTVGRSVGRSDLRAVRYVDRHRLRMCARVRVCVCVCVCVSAVTLTRNTLAFPFSRRAPTSAIPRQDRYRVALRERDGPFTPRRERTRNVCKYNNTCWPCVYRAAQPASYDGGSVR